MNIKKLRNALITTCFFLTSALLCSIAVHAQAASLESEASSGASSYRVGAHSYGNWSSQAYSYLHANADGTFTRFECIGNKLLAETYSSAKKLLKAKTIKMELPLFGGVYITEDAYYVLLGNRNASAAKNVTEFRFIKYNTHLVKIASSNVKNANTTIAFDAGGCSFVQAGDVLYVRTCHQMYNGHQASVQFKVDMTTMQVLTANAGVSNSAYGYVSHSFNQFQAVKDGVVYVCDHGDAYPRGICMIRLNDLKDGSSSFSNDATSLVSMKFAGETGNNYTGATLGGFTLTENTAIAVGTSKTQSNSKYCSVKNVFVNTVPLDAFSSGNAKTHFITSYAKTGKRTCENPYLVKVNENKLLLIWEESIRSQYDRTRYVWMDGSGKTTSSIHSLYTRLSDCQPIVSGNQIVWYYTTNSAPVFVTLPLSGSASTGLKKGKTFQRNGLTYRVLSTKKNKGTVAVTGYKASQLTNYYAMASDTYANGCKYKVTALGTRAFANCKKLTDLNLSSTITKIGSNAFAGCTHLRTIGIPKMKTAKFNRLVSKLRKSGVKSNVRIGMLSI